MAFSQADEERRALGDFTKAVLSSRVLVPLYGLEVLPS